MQRLILWAMRRGVKLLESQRVAMRFEGERDADGRHPWREIHSDLVHLTNTLVNFVDQGLREKSWPHSAEWDSVGDQFASIFHKVATATRSRPFSPTPRSTARAEILWGFVSSRARAGGGSGSPLHCSPSQKVTLGPYQSAVPRGRSARGRRPRGPGDGRRLVDISRASWHPNQGLRLQTATAVALDLRTAMRKQSPWSS